MFYQHRWPISWSCHLCNTTKVHQQLLLMALASKLITHETDSPCENIAHIHSWTSEIHSLEQKQSYLPLNILYADWLLHLWIIVSIHACMYNLIHAGRKSSLVLLDWFVCVRLQIYVRNFMVWINRSEEKRMPWIMHRVLVERLGGGVCVCGEVKANQFFCIPVSCWPPFVSLFLKSDQYVDWSAAASWAPALV